MSKPIESIHIIPVHRKMLVLCDSKVLCLHMHTLQLVEDAKILKGALCLCRDEGSNLALTPDLDFTVVRKKGLYQFEFSDTSLLAHKTLKDQEEGDHKDTVALARDGAIVCAAQKRGYNMVNLRTGEVTDLFPFDPERTVPIVKRISHNEVCS